MYNEFIIIGLLVIILGQITYLITKLPRVSAGKRRMVFVDTSVLIDGRILSVAQSGFIGDTLVIPRSVVGELQYMADNADHDKRTRARYGLDMVKQLQETAEVDVLILQDGDQAKEGVDNRLLKLAKKYSGVIATIDYNLNKVAAVEGTPVLNVNELAKNLRMAYLPGERAKIELVQKGQDGHQAVGYLADGTMVVVEHASSMLNKVIEVEFIRSLQTQAGKMMFAKPTTQLQQKIRKDAPKNLVPTGRRPQPKMKKPKDHEDRLIELAGRQ